MELVNASRKLTIREYKAIEANLRAFEHNFGKRKRTRKAVAISTPVITLNI